MKEFENRFRTMASLLGDAARSVMLWNLLDGRSYTATELAMCADISPQSASNHLAKLVNAGILEVQKQGRHRYYSYASPDAAHVIESIASLLPPRPEEEETHRPTGIAYARSCYDHLAGGIGVAVTDSLVRMSILDDSHEGYLVTPDGEVWFSTFGLDLQEVGRQKRSFARKCLDWSERRHHLAGALGASLLQSMLERKWFSKSRASRQLLITPKGKSELRRRLGLDI